MATSTSYQDVEKKFNPKHWNSIEEFEEYYLQIIADEYCEPNYYTDKTGKERFIPSVNHYPELKEYEVWAEGYRATGEEGEAFLWGKAKARNFGQACHIVMCRSYLERIEKENQPGNKEYTSPGTWAYDPSRFKYWGCKLYWNEELARKAFG